MGKHELKKPDKSIAKKSRFRLVIAVVGLIAVLAITIISLGNKEIPAQGTIPVEQNQEAKPIETEIHTAAPIETEMHIAEPIEQTKTPRKELVINSVEQQDNMLVVNTSYGTVRYPFAFSDLIEIIAANQEEQSFLEWYVLLGESKYQLFTITFNGTDGVLLGTMVVENGKSAEPVYMQFFAADEKLEGAELETFSAVQEILNDVIMSLEDNEGFTAAE